MVTANAFVKLVAGVESNTFAGKSTKELQPNHVPEKVVTLLVFIKGKEVKELQSDHVRMRLTALLVFIEGKEVKELQPAHV